MLDRMASLLLIDSVTLEAGMRVSDDLCPA